MAVHRISFNSGPVPSVMTATVWWGLSTSQCVPAPPPPRSRVMCGGREVTVTCRDRSPTAFSVFCCRRPGADVTSTCQASHVRHSCVLRAVFSYRSQGANMLMFQSWLNILFMTCVAVTLRRSSSDLVTWNGLREKKNIPALFGLSLEIAYPCLLAYTRINKKVYMYMYMCLLVSSTIFKTETFNASTCTLCWQLMYT